MWWIEFGEVNIVIDVVSATMKGVIGEMRLALRFNVSYGLLYPSAGDML